MSVTPDFGCFLDITTGVATWFCCGSPYGPCSSTHSHGCCGTCNNSAYQIAWPRVSGHTNYTACGYSLPAYACGTQLWVRDVCNNDVVGAVIADCGPYMVDLCNGRASDCKSYKTHVVDLTPATFSAIANLATGVISARVQRYANPCPQVAS